MTLTGDGVKKSSWLAWLHKIFFFWTCVYKNLDDIFYNSILFAWDICFWLCYWLPLILKLKFLGWYSILRAWVDFLAGELGLFIFVPPCENISSILSTYLGIAKSLILAFSVIFLSCTSFVAGVWKPLIEVAIFEIRFWSELKWNLFRWYSYFFKVMGLTIPIAFWNAVSGGLILPKKLRSQAAAGGVKYYSFLEFRS